MSPSLIYDFIWLSLSGSLWETWVVGSSQVQWLSFSSNVLPSPSSARGAMNFLFDAEYPTVHALATHESLYWPLYDAKRFIWSRLRTALLYGFKQMFKKQLDDMFNQQDMDKLFSYRPDEGPQCWAGTLSYRSGLRNNWLPCKSHVTIIALGISDLENCYCSKPGKTISDFFPPALSSNFQHYEG